MEWTYCLDCGAPQFPGDAACPECAAGVDPADAGTAEAAYEPTQTWASVLRSIWIAHMMAAAGGLLLALGLGFCLGYASRVMSRPALVRRPEPVPPAAWPGTGPSWTESAAVGPELPVSSPLLIAPVDMSAGAGPAPIAAAGMLVGPPKPLATPPAEPVDDAWDLEGVRPPPEHWLHLRFRDREPQTARLPTDEPLPPSVQLYGQFLPGPSSVEVQWQIPTPREWHGAVVPSALE